ncbi:synaptic vesicular amine transporter-like [Clavelina lepadiformis]|uniref:synaptic vesicular amine transporter-like n=1 Tax=Clavelina lepadiformis TaxID=159417 RepID=UPI00404102BE
MVIVYLLMIIDYGLLSMTFQFFQADFSNTHFISNTDPRNDISLSANATSDTTATNLTATNLTATNLTAAIQGVTPQNFRDDEHAILATQNVHPAAIFAVKPAVQSVVNLLSGSLIDRFGYGVPMFVGTVALLLTAIGYGFGQSYTVLLVSAALHGIGSSCVTVGGMTMLARIFNDKEERAKTFRMALSSMAIGMTAGPVFAKGMDSFQDKIIPFFVFVVVITVIGFCQIFCIGLKIERNKKPMTLMKLPNVSCILLAVQGLMITGFVLGVLIGGFPDRLLFRFQPSKLELGDVFLYGIVGFELSAILIHKLPFNNWPWIDTVIGMVILFIGLIMLTLSPSFLFITVPTIGYGINFITGSIYPDLPSLLEANHNSHYGTVFALADFGFSISFAAGLLSYCAIVATSTMSCG